MPYKIIQIEDIPYTINGKKVELAVKNIVEGKNVDNIDSLSNPESLNFETIEKIKNLPSNSRLIDIPFADRYSLAIINAKEVLKLNKAQLFSLSKNFFTSPA